MRAIELLMMCFSTAHTTNLQKASPVRHSSLSPDRLMTVVFRSRSKIDPRPNQISFQTPKQNPLRNSIVRLYSRVWIWDRRSTCDQRGKPETRTLRNSIDRRCPNRLITVVFGPVSTPRHNETFLIPKCRIHSMSFLLQYHI